MSHFILVPRLPRVRLVPHHLWICQLSGTGSVSARKLRNSATFYMKLYCCNRFMKLGYHSQALFPCRQTNTRTKCRYNPSRYSAAGRADHSHWLATHSRTLGICMQYLSYVIVHVQFTDCLLCNRQHCASCSCPSEVQWLKCVVSFSCCAHQLMSCYSWCRVSMDVLTGVTTTDAVAASDVTSEAAAGGALNDTEH